MRDIGTMAPIFAVLVALAGASESAGAAPDTEMVDKVNQTTQARVTLDEGSFRLQYPKADDQGLRFRGVAGTRQPAPAPQPIAWERVHSIELKRTGARNGAIAGFLVGAGLGVMTMVVSASAGASPSGDVDAAAAGAGVAAMVLLTGLGAAIGSTFHHWQPIYVRDGLAPAAPGHCVVPPVPGIPPVEPERLHGVP